MKFQKFYHNKFCNGRTDGQAESNMPLQLSKVGGIQKIAKSNNSKKITVF